MSRRAFAMRFAIALAAVLGFGTAGFAEGKKPIGSEQALFQALAHPAVPANESHVSVCRPQPDAPWPGIKREFDFRMDLLLPPLEVKNRPDWTPFAC